MKALSIFAVAFVVLLSGCELIPDNQNDAKKPISIDADGVKYFTCSPFTVTRDRTDAGITYNLVFTRAAVGTEVSLKGVRKLEIAEMPKMVDGPMPFPLPDIRFARDGDGNPYKEGTSYGFGGGEHAQVKGGKWVPMKVPNKICEEQ